MPKLRKKIQGLCLFTDLKNDVINPYQHSRCQRFCTDFHFQSSRITSRPILNKRLLITKTFIQLHIVKSNYNIFYLKLTSEFQLTYRLRPAFAMIENIIFLGIKSMHF